jgi:hypothetical protein
MKNDNIYERLFEEKISIEEIASNKLFIEMNAKAMSIEPTYGIDTPQRTVLRQDIKRQLLATGAVTIGLDGNVEYTAPIIKEKRADIVIGLPAAGKSTILAIPLSKAYGSRIIDSDMAKAMLPEYENGIGAFAVHFESKAIIDEVFKSAIEKGENIVITIIGDKAKKILSLAERLKERGYRTYLHLNEVLSETSIRRAALRYMEQGRYIPITLLVEYKNKPSEVYEEIKNSEVFYGYSKYSNDVPRGEKATCLENYERSPLQGMENSRDFDGRYGDRLDNRETRNGRNGSIGNRAVDLSFVAVHPLRIYQSDDDKVLVKIENQQAGEKKPLYLQKEKVQIDKQGMIVAVEQSVVNRYGLKTAAVKTPQKRY